MLKASENPPISWPEQDQITDFIGNWWVVHTKSRNEKALANDLITKNISYFLPMKWKLRQTRGRKIKSLLPLFSGYLFFCGNEEQRINVLRTNRVANLIEVKDQQKFLDQILKIHKALISGVDLTPHNYIKTGQCCRVTAGPLQGLEGIVVRTKNISRLIMQIDMLGQATSAEVDTDLIEAIDKNNS